MFLGARSPVGVATLAALAVFATGLAVATPLLSVLGGPGGSSFRSPLWRGQPASQVSALGEASVTVDPGSTPLRSIVHRAGRPAPAPGKRTALLIGINHARGGATLPGSVTDATNVRDALLMYGFPRNNITMLLEGQATRANILGQIDALAARTPSDGVAVFAIATHTRRRGGTNELLTADGLRISAPELASHLAAVRSRAWIALPTCYAGGYALKGIVGHNRVATFATSADRPTYQLGDAGSYLIINMVREAMLDGYAPFSVETAFQYAHDELERDAPDRVPQISDGIAGDLILGSAPPPTARKTLRASSRSRTRPAAPPEPEEYSSATMDSGGYGDAQPDPESTEQPQSNSSVGVCGSFRYRCGD